MGVKSLEVRFVELQAEVKFLRKRNKELEKEKSDLTIRLDKSYEALTAKEAPMAYADQKAEEWETNHPEKAEARTKREMEIEATAEIQRELEGPIFKDADDMISLLTRPLKKVDSKPGNYKEES